MKTGKPKSAAGTSRPSAFPALTKAQKDWVAARREELKITVQDGIESGKKSGYREFDAKRLLAFIAERPKNLVGAKKKRA